MEIINGEAFSEDVNYALSKYFSYVLEQEKDFYYGLPIEISKIQKKISKLEGRADIAESIAESLEKLKPGSLFDMFIGCYAPDLRKYVDANDKEISRLYDKLDKKQKFYNLYSNVLYNGVIINDNLDGFYSVEPFDGSMIHFVISGKVK